MIELRPATLDDHAVVLPRTRALNRHEGIDVADDALAAALDHLLRDPSLGGVWLIERDRAVVGYAIITFGYDLEFAGRDAWLTEIWVDPDHRGAGVAGAALELLAGEARRLGVRGLHLQVRPDNPAARLYHRAGFAEVPRRILSRRL